VGWAGGPDFADGIVARAASNAVRSRRTLTLADFSTGFDNTDVYRFMYAHLFGTVLPPATTLAPSR
jgi:alkaline phosphatase